MSPRSYAHEHIWGFMQVIFLYIQHTGAHLSAVVGGVLSHDGAGEAAAVFQQRQSSLGEKRCRGLLAFGRQRLVLHSTWWRGRCDRSTFICSSSSSSPLLCCQLVLASSTAHDALVVTLTFCSHHLGKLGLQEGSHFFVFLSLPEKENTSIFFFFKFLNTL